MPEQRRIEFANTLRGMAALLVLITHYCGVFWNRRAAITYLTTAPELSNTIFPTPHYLAWIGKLDVFDFGPYGVSVFFIISGFVIPFSLQKSTTAGFLANRFLRIFPTYIIGFSITLLFIYFSTQRYHTALPFTPKDIFVHYIPGLRDIMSTREIDGVVWTLDIEVKFYLVCALLIRLFRVDSYKIFFAPLFLFISALLLGAQLGRLETGGLRLYQLSLMYYAEAQYIIFMFIGVAFNYLYRNKICAEKAFLLIGSMFMMFCFLWHAGPGALYSKYTWTYGLGVLTFIFAYTFPVFFRKTRTGNFFAKISYPLYIVHGVAGYTIIRTLLEHGIKAWLSMILATLASISIAWLIHLLIENPMRQFAKNKIIRDKSAATAAIKKS